MIEKSDGSLLADARVPIEDFEARVGPVLEQDERDEVDTLGGLVFSLAGRVPSRGELLTHPSSGLEFEIIDADPRRIKRSPRPQPATTATRRKVSPMTANSRPIVRLADAFRRLTGWRRNLTVIAAGARRLDFAAAGRCPAAALADHPGPGLGPGRGTDQERRALWVGWLFSFGYLAFSLYWLTFALFVAIDQYWWLVPFASSGLAFGLSIYFGIGTMIATRVPRERPLARVLALTAMWSLAEWVYGHALTGFPWNLPGYAWTEFPWLIQSASWIGIYGVTVLVLLAPALAALLGDPSVSVTRGRWTAGSGVRHRADRRHRRGDPPAGGTDGDPAGCAAEAGAAQHPAEPEMGRRDVRQESAAAYRTVAGQPADKPPTAIIWSEAAEPFPAGGLSRKRQGDSSGRCWQPGQLLITGIDRDQTKETPPTFRDSIQVLTAAATSSQPTTSSITCRSANICR